MDTCAICLSSADESLSIPCGHVYHPACIQPWQELTNSCPCCRMRIDPAKQAVPLRTTTPAEENDEDEGDGSDTSSEGSDMDLETESEEEWDTEDEEAQVHASLEATWARAAALRQSVEEADHILRVEASRLALARMIAADEAERCRKEAMRINTERVLREAKARTRKRPAEDTLPSVSKRNGGGGGGGDGGSSSDKCAMQ